MLELKNMNRQSKQHKKGNVLILLCILIPIILLSIIFLSVINNSQKSSKKSEVKSSILPITPIPPITPFRPSTPSSQPSIQRRVVGRIQPRVLLIIFNPIIKSQGNKKLTQVKNWNDPVSLTNQYISDLYEVSNGFTDYKIKSKMEINDIPVKLDGFKYTEESYLNCLSNPSTCHQPDMVDYGKIFQKNNVCNLVKAMGISEVWLWGGPYFGYYEWNVKGPKMDLWSVNLPNCGKTTYVMGFNYERGVGEMLEDFGHRTEGILTQVIANGNWQKNEDNEWNKFSLYPKHCGNVHYGPNSVSDYDWSNQNYVSSNCDDWYTYPTLSGNYKNINCTQWGCDMRGHHKWWLKHLPKTTGTTNGKLNNWWQYMVNLDNSGY